jgi:hypothetical protein
MLKVDFAAPLGYEEPKPMNVQPQVIDLADSKQILKEVSTVTRSNCRKIY